MDIESVLSQGLRRITNILKFSTLWRTMQKLPEPFTFPGITLRGLHLVLNVEHRERNPFWEYDRDEGCKSPNYIYIVTIIDHVTNSSTNLNVCIFTSRMKMLIQWHFAVAFDIECLSLERATRSPFVLNNATYGNSREQMAFSPKAPSQSCHVHGSTRPGSGALLVAKQNIPQMDTSLTLLQEFGKGREPVLRSVWMQPCRSSRELDALW